MRTPPKPTKISSNNCVNVILIVIVAWLGLLSYYWVSTHSVIVEQQKAQSEKMVLDLIHKLKNSVATHQLSANNGNSESQPTNSALAGMSSNPTPQLIQQNPPAVIVRPKAATVASKDDDSTFHTAFSTDCSFFQDWQTLLIFHSAVMVGQKGRITRIASGCKEDKQKELLTLYQKLYPQYSIHFTPDFKTDSKTKKKYDFYNKPYGVQHWLTHAQPPVESGTVVNIIDPDMIFLRPMSAEVRSNPANIFMNHFNPKQDVVPERVARGQPVAQLYGLGAPWAQRFHRHFNRTEVCGPDSPCLKTTVEFGEQHFSVGPPYLLEKDDWMKLLNAWTTFVPRVYEKYPSLLAEMYAYSMAAAHTNLPHFTLHNLMVSNVNAGDEGWKWIDQLGDDICVPPVADANGKVVFYPDKTMPSVLHFCQFYRAAEIGFQKRRVKKEIFDCNGNMMVELPRNIGKVGYKNRDGEIIKMGPTETRRNAFMLCTLHTAINNMIDHYKSVMCPPGEINRNKTINLVAKGYY